MINKIHIKWIMVLDRQTFEYCIVVGCGFTVLTSCFNAHNHNTYIYFPQNRL